MRHGTRSYERRHSVILCAAIICCIGVAVTPAGATPTPAQEIDPSRINERLEAVRAEIREGAPDSDSQWLALLRRHESALAQLRDQLERRSELTAPAPMPTPVPDGVVSVPTLDAALDELDRVSGALSAQRDVVELTRTQVASAREDREEVSRQLRAVRSGSDTDMESAPSRVELERRLEILDDEIALHRVQLDNARSLLSQQQRLKELLQERTDGLRSRVEPQPDTLEAILAALDDEEHTLRRELQAAQDAEEVARNRLETARRDGQQDEARLAAHRAELELARRRASMAADQLQLLPSLREMWEQRWTVLGGQADWEQMTAAREAAGELKTSIERHLRQVELELEQHEGARTAIDSASTDSRWLLERRRLTNELVEAERAHRQRLRDAGTEVQRLRNELEGTLSKPALSQRISRLARGVQTVWQYELIAYDEHPLTVGKLVVASLLLIVGLVLSRRISRLIVRRVSAPLGLTQSSIATTQTVVRYILIVLIALIALRIANIPLTVFTLLGGALAIGVGFGSQNVVSNFISGLILLVERPIKVGDLVEVGGTFGRVEYIGPRSTFVRTPENIHIIVPNANFLEKEVVNWTLADYSIRSTLVVGVAYGSPVRDVERLLYQALREHPKVLAEPEPTVLFADFGDSALIFESTFWTTIRTQLDRRRLLSDLRFRIDELFRENEIVIAFPQRDVHLDTTTPLDVRVTTDSDHSE